MADMSPEKFRNRLQEILEKAYANQMRIEKSQVDTFFSSDGLSQEQMPLVYDFLLSRKVVVEGYDKQENEDSESSTALQLTEEEQRWLAAYMEDLDGILPEKEGEWKKLVRSMDDSNTQRRVTELLLKDVVSLAKSVHNGSIHLSDLVQEGSLGMILAMDSLDVSAIDANGTDVEIRNGISGMILSQIRESMLALTEEQADVHTRDRKFVEKVEDLKDGVSVLKEEYGRKVYLDEVADFMSISEDEAANILRLAGEEIPDEEN